MNIKQPKEHKYFVVPKLTKREECIIIESKATFNHKEFAEEIKEQLAYLEIEKDELARACYMPICRLNSIINCTGRKITDEEVKEIKKRLSIT